MMADKKVDVSSVHGALQTSKEAEVILEINISLNPF